MDRLGILNIVEISQGHEVQPRIFSHSRVDDSAQRNGLLVTPFLLIRDCGRQSRLQMRGNQRETKVRVDLYHQIGKPAFDFESAAIEQKTFIGMIAPACPTRPL
jgi:hypothetical protein